MFFDSIGDGLQILTYWRFWAVLLGAGVVGILPTLILVALSMATERSAGKNTALGCLITPVTFIWTPVVLTVTIILLWPLMVARYDVINIDFVRVFSVWQITKMVLLGVITVIIVSIIPFIGSLHSVPFFAQSSVILSAATSIFSHGRAVLWPGILNSVGFALVGSILSTLIFYALMLPIVALLQNRGEESPLLISKTLGFLPALIPACIYAGWLRHANGL